MQAFYDAKPSKIEAIGNGSYAYRYNIKEVDKPVQGDSEKTSEVTETKKQWSCEEVIVWAPLSSNKITEAVITSRWDANYEQKLVNEYNAAQLGLFGAKTSEEAKARIKAYTEYLSERAALKTQVDADCAELDIK